MFLRPTFHQLPIRLAPIQASSPGMATTLPAQLRLHRTSRGSQNSGAKGQSSSGTHSMCVTSHPVHELNKKITQIFVAFFPPQDPRSSTRRHQRVKKKVGTGRKRAFAALPRRPRLRPRSGRRDRRRSGGAGGDSTRTNGCTPPTSRCCQVEAASPYSLSLIHI